MDKLLGKVALVSASYLDGVDKVGNDRFERTQTWIDFHLAIKPEIGFDDIVLFDNYSTQERFDRITGARQVRFDEHLPTGPGQYEYPYCWRAMWQVKQLISEGYSKIIALDTDCYVVSSGFAHLLKSTNKGWETFWIPKYEFPSTECVVLNKDSFHLFQEYTSVDWRSKVGTLMETNLPFTAINKKPKVDRYGEDRINQEDWMDGYFQRPLDIPLKFTR